MTNAVLFSNYRMLAKQLYRFVVAGSIGAIVNYAIFVISYALLSINYMLSSVLGFFMSSIIAYRLSKQWVFVNRNNDSKYVFYITLLASSMAAGLLVMNFSVVYLMIDPLYAQIISMLTTTIINFIGSKYLVFR